MRSVLISIRPEWVEKIILKEKTIEVRKTRPKLEPPFKCYIYCSKARSKEDQLERLELLPDCHWERLDGKVIAEFTCYNIHKVYPSCLLPKDFERRACMNSDKIWDYLHGQGWAWHISNLHIYPEPVDLKDFWGTKPCRKTYDCCACEKWDDEKMDCNEPLSITRPPQSWCYVEEP